MLDGKVAIVTGGSRGIGRAIAESFGDAGASVVLVALHDANLEGAVESLEARDVPVAFVAGDVAEAATATIARDLAVDAFGSIDILVNCAGTITRTPMEDLSYPDWQRVLDVNLSGPFHMSKAVLPAMVERRAGKIINVTSQMARIPHPSASPSYEVSKAGLAAFTRHLANHYARWGICVNSIAPGSIDTDLPKSMSEEARERLRRAIPLGRLGEPDEVGHLATFLASSLSDYITGATITITGGSLMD